MSNSFEHLEALELRLFHNRERLAKCNSKNATELYKVWIAQNEKEIADEIAFLAKKGIVRPAVEEMTTDELLAALKF